MSPATDDCERCDGKGYILVRSECVSDSADDQPCPDCGGAGGHNGQSEVPLSQANRAAHETSGRSSGGAAQEVTSVRAPQPDTGASDISVDERGDCGPLCDCSACENERAARASHGEPPRHLWDNPAPSRADEGILVAALAGLQITESALADARATAHARSAAFRGEQLCVSCDKPTGDDQELCADCEYVNYQEREDEAALEAP